MLAIRINPNNFNWSQYEFMVRHDNPKRNLFKRHFEYIFTDSNLSDEKCEFDELTLMGFRFFSLDAINNSQICVNNKIGFLYGLKKTHEGEDAIIFTKTANKILLVGIIINIHYLEPCEFSEIAPQFISEWTSFSKNTFINEEGKSFFDRYQRDYLNDNLTSKFAFNLRYQDLIFFENHKHIDLNEYCFFNKNTLNKDWISKIDSEDLKSILIRFKL